MSAAIWALHLFRVKAICWRQFSCGVCVLSCSFGDLLSFTLTAFVELMDHGIVSWDTFSVAFIKKVSPENLPPSKMGKTRGAVLRERIRLCPRCRSPAT